MWVEENFEATAQIEHHSSSDSFIVVCWNIAHERQKTHQKMAITTMGNASWDLYGNLIHFLREWLRLRGSSGEEIWVSHPPAPWPSLFPSYRSVRWKIRLGVRFSSQFNMPAAACRYCAIALTGVENCADLEGELRVVLGLAREHRLGFPADDTEKWRQSVSGLVFGRGSPNGSIETWDLITDPRNGARDRGMGIWLFPWTMTWLGGS